MVNLSVYSVKAILDRASKKLYDMRIEICIVYINRDPDKRIICRLQDDFFVKPMCYDVIARLKEALLDRKGGHERWRTACIVLKRFRMFTRAFH